MYHNLYFHILTLGKLFTHMPLLPNSLPWNQLKGSDVLQLGQYISTFIVLLVVI